MNIRVLTALALVAVALQGCAVKTPFAPIARTPLPNVSRDEAIASLTRPGSPDYRTRLSIGFHKWWIDAPLAGYARVSDGETPSLRFVAMTDLGVKLFDVETTSTGARVNYVLSRLEKHGKVAEPLGRDLGRAFLDLAPRADDTFKISKDAYEFSDSATTLVYGGKRQVLLEKRVRRARRLDWRAQFFEHDEAGAPRGVRIDNRRAGYTLIVTVIERREEGSGK